MIPDDPELNQILEDFTREVLPKIQGSNLSISLVPGDSGDLKFWLETAAMMMLDKPIVLLNIGGRWMPPKLVKIADHVIEATDSKDAAIQVEAYLRKAMEHDG